MDTKLLPCSDGLLNVDLNPYSTVAEMPPVATLPAAPESQSQSRSDLMDIMNDDELGGWMEEKDQLASDPLDVGGQHEGTFYMTVQRHRTILNIHHVHVFFTRLNVPIDLCRILSQQVYRVTQVRLMTTG